MNNEQKDELQRIEDMMKSTTSSENDDSKAENNGGQNKRRKPNKNKKSPKKIIAAVSVVAVGFVATTGILLYTNSDEKEKFVDKTETPSWVSGEKTKQTEEVDNSTKYPIALEKWASSPYSEKGFWTEDNSKATLKYNSQFKSLGFNYLLLDSETEKVYDDVAGTVSSPKTGDLDKRFNKDGKENEDFVFVTREDYQKQFTVAVQRLINPTFGGWADAQQSNLATISNDKFNSLKDMFTDSWWSKNVKENSDYSKLPLLADWKNDWSKLDLDTNIKEGQGTFYGEIDAKGNKKVTSKVKGNDSAGFPIVEYSIPVKFSALGETEKNIQKTGTLKFTVQPNLKAKTNTTKVVISEASLIIKDAKKVKK